MTRKVAPLGWRNNNPLNICKSKAMWAGEVTSNGRFCKFKSFYWGLRAAFILLDTYQKIHRRYTIKEIINRWAPPSENDTNGYVRYVCQRMQMEPDDRVTLFNVSNLVTAMGEMEIGMNWFHTQEIRENMSVICGNRGIPFPSLMAERMKVFSKR